MTQDFNLEVSLQTNGAALSAQEIGNALYGLHNMEASIPSVSQLLSLLESKRPLNFSYEQNPLAWPQVFVSI